jgi:hypothetical protein
MKGTLLPPGRPRLGDPEAASSKHPSAPEDPTGPGSRRPRIDPRFARRWTQVRREQGRHRLRIVVGTIAVVVLAAGSLYSPLFNARHVRVTATGSISTKAVVSVAGLAHPRPLIEVDTRAVTARLDAVPQWGAARVRRSWPTTIIITVALRRPIVVVARTGLPAGTTGWATVDATGRVLADVSVAPPGVPVVQGVGPVPVPGGWLEGSAGPKAIPPPAAAGHPLVDLGAAADSASVPAGTAAALAVVAAVPASVRGQVQTMIVGPHNELSMSVLPAIMAAGSIPVYLGDGSQLAAKLTALVTLLTQANLSGVTGLDLTVPDRPAALTARQTPGTVSTHAGG